jgi:hypothetical protein
MDIEIRRMQGVYKDELDPLIPHFDEDHDDYTAGYRRSRQQVTVHDDKKDKPSDSSGGAQASRNHELAITR